MADDTKPGGSDASVKPEQAPGQPAKPAAEAAQAAPPKPAAAAPPKPPATMAATAWDSELSRELKEGFGERIVEASTYLGQNFLVVRPDAVIPILEYLKLEADFDFLVDVTAVDWPKRAERFDLVYIVYSFARNERVRIKTYIPDGFRPPSATSLYRTANWLEREVFDMFGIEFAGHPDLRRILLPDEWRGHPLRKDYSIIQQDERWVQENLEIESAQ
jgi:NADH-quinone oxidoreductase subunit C